VGGDPRDLLHGALLHPGQGLADDRHPHGLVATAPVSLGCEQGRVGLDHQPLEGKRRSDAAQPAIALEGEDAREGDVEVAVQGSAGEVEGARVAVQDALDLAAALGVPDVEHLAEGVGLVAAHVDRNREPPAPRRGHLLGEHLALYVS
jgi:hypothetical protein